LAWLLLGLGILLLPELVGPLARSFLGRLILHRLRASLGLEADISELSLGRSGRIHIRSLAIRLPSAEGGGLLLQDIDIRGILGALILGRELQVQIRRADGRITQIRSWASLERRPRWSLAARILVKSSLIEAPQAELLIICDEVQLHRSGAAISLLACAGLVRLPRDQGSLRFRFRGAPLQERLAEGQLELFLGTEEPLARALGGEALRLRGRLSVLADSLAFRGGQLRWPGGELELSAEVERAKGSQASDTWLGPTRLGLRGQLACSFGCVSGELEFRGQGARRSLIGQLTSPGLSLEPLGGGTWGIASLTAAIEIGPSFLEWRDLKSALVSGGELKSHGSLERVGGLWDLESQLELSDIDLDALPPSAAGARLGGTLGGLARAQLVLGGVLGDVQSFSGKGALNIAAPQYRFLRQLAPRAQALGLPMPHEGGRGEARARIQLRGGRLELAAIEAPLVGMGFGGSWGFDRRGAVSGMILVRIEKLALRRRAMLVLPALLTGPLEFRLRAGGSLAAPTLRIDGESLAQGLSPIARASAFVQRLIDKRGDS